MVKVIKKSWSEIRGFKPISITFELMYIEALLEAVKVAYPKMCDAPYYIMENHLSHAKRQLEKAKETILNRK